MRHPSRGNDNFPSFIGAVKDTEITRALVMTGFANPFQIES